MMPEESLWEEEVRLEGLGGGGRPWRGPNPPPTKTELEDGPAGAEAGLGVEERSQEAWLRERDGRCVTA